MSRTPANASTSKYWPSAAKQTRVSRMRKRRGRSGAVEHGSFAKMHKFVNRHGFKGIIAKRSDSP